MSFMSILVHVNESRHLQKRVELAVRLAKENNGHVIGVAMTDISRYIFETLPLGFEDPNILSYLNTLRERVKTSLEQFKLSIHQVDPAQVETRLIDAEAMDGLSLEARYADLVILGQFDPEDQAQMGQATLPEYVAMASGCPVLLVPYSSMTSSIGERVLIAWNGSPEAKRAVFFSLPLLQRAKAVEIVSFATYGQVQENAPHPAMDLASYLARHGVDANILQEEAVADVGDALLSIAANISSDLLVMGCYGNSRMREILLGGATKKILQSTTLPVLLAH